MSAMPTHRPPSRFKLDPLSKRDYPLHLIQEGAAILESLQTIGFATNGQLTRLHFANRRSRSAAKRTYSAAERAARISLQRLWQSGFIERRPVLLSSKRTGFGYQHFVNILTPKGERSTSRNTDDPDLRPRRSPIKISNQTVEHSLTINDVYVLARRAAEERGIGFHDWLDDRQLTAMKVAGRLNLVSIPDGFFVLSVNGRYYGHFLEIDTGSETIMSKRSPRSWSQTVADYGQYFREHYPQDGYFKGFVAPIVLTITRSETRLINLLKATKRGGGAGVYWYTTENDIQATTVNDTTRRVVGFTPAVFWGPIWRVVNDRTPRSLHDRLNHIGIAS